MWISKKISINNKSHDAMVNTTGKQAEVEVPYFEGWDDLGSVEIDSKSFTIAHAVNVGARDEMIKLTLRGKSNESKQTKSRKAT